MGEKTSFFLHKSRIELSSLQQQNFSDRHISLIQYRKGTKLASWNDLSKAFKPCQEIPPNHLELKVMAV